MVHCILDTTYMKGRAHPSPFAVLSFPDSKQVRIYSKVVGVFLSSDGEAMVRINDFPETFGKIIESLSLLDYGSSL